ncbi:MAG: signal peptidase II [Candidatus Omnitrophota bacterium]|nr:signal peptidase II [Candidatus Omnitrophota bacterium]
MVIFIISVLVLALDQLTKRLISIYFYLGQSQPIIKNIFHLTLVHNKGVAFGLFCQKAALFVFISSIVIILIVVSFPKIKGRCLLLKTGLSLILGGALGNLIDRLVFGYVIDFLDFRIWPVFNIADSAITIGAGLLVLHLLKTKKPKT